MAEPKKKPAAKKTTSSKTTANKSAESAPEAPTVDQVEETTEKAAPSKSNVPDRVWKPSESDKHQATWRRWTAVGLWAAAIAIEIWLLFFFIRNAVPFTDKDLYILIGVMVLLAILSVIGSNLWKKANRFDPASEKNKFKFWVQNQLGMILAIAAFLPLVIVILTNKNMNGKQKGIAGAVAVILGIGASLYGADFHPVSVEQYSQETGLVEALTGADEVYWSSSKGSKIFHICDSGAGTGDDSYSFGHWAERAEDSGATIEKGTVKEAHLAGKERLSKSWEGEAKRCGIDQEVIDDAWSTSPIDIKYIENDGKGEDSGTE